MIEKIVAIKNIGKFRNCIAPGDTFLRRLTLIFAENGRGKTTLCSILRSLQSGKREFITERKTLGVTEQPSVHIRLDGSNFNFSNNTWSCTYPNIAIFDSVFVHDNVYSGDYIEHDHKKNLYRVIIGSQGVQLAQQVDLLDEQIRVANDEIRNKKDAVERHIPHGVRLDEYLQWPVIENIDYLIEQKQSAIHNRQLAISKASEIQSKGVFSKIQLPPFLTNFTVILGKQLPDIIETAENRIKQHITAHKMAVHGETWLSQGLNYITNGQCPFCGQSIDANDLIAIYSSHFNNAYKELKQDVGQMSQRLMASIGDTALSPVQQILSTNLILIEFWKQFIADIALQTISFEDIQLKYANLRDHALSLVHLKQERPTEHVAPSSDFSSALAEVEALRGIIQQYNVMVDECNTKINKQKALVQHGNSIVELKRELLELEAKKKRYSTEVIEACRAYNEAQAIKTRKDAEKNAAKQSLNQYSLSVLNTYEQSINEYLEKFCAGFRIANSQQSYRGGSPSSQYQIEINKITVDLGDAKTPQGTPCFKTTLSSGDRSSLALAFFLSTLKQDTDIGNKIIVLDDPFTSLDRFRRTCTQQIIWGLVGNAKQVVVLSHDANFLKLIFDAHSSSEVKTLQLHMNKITTILKEWNIIEETQSTYMKNYSTLIRYVQDEQGQPIDVARAIRPFLEGLFRVHFPGDFQPNEWLGDFINKIRSAISGSGLQHAQSDLTELQEINDYSKKFHHDQNPNADAEPVNTDELMTFVLRTLKLAGGSS